MCRGFTNTYIATSIIDSRYMFCNNVSSPRNNNSIMCYEKVFIEYVSLRLHFANNNAVFLSPRQQNPILTTGCILLSTDEITALAHANGPSFLRGRARHVAENCYSPTSAEFVGVPYATLTASSSISMNMHSPGHTSAAMTTASR